MKDVVTFLALQHFFLMELFVQAEDHNISVVEVFNRASSRLQQIFHVTKLDTCSTNVRVEHCGSSSKSFSASQEDLFFGSDEFIKEFDKTIAKAKNLKEKMMP